ncbi:ATP-binding cassette domain-containing protein [Bacteroidales bacterium OttesenSCG-928-K22]|nr:ATP-binding cassette domain-containing protein [Bacteroidales bacterium OttesenSCG-928-L14]MDL2240211.1 ATP-binding cassette domain-containing protein [Bacteroidales bacterium OttesenSCG-928-K22]
MSILSINNLSYSHPNKDILLKNINLSVERGEKVSLIGNNGSGKSTLLKLITGSLTPSSGSVFSSGNIYFVPQHYSQYNDCKIADALNVQHILNALEMISAGTTNLDYYNILEGNWDIEERIAKALSYWKLTHININRDLGSLSGGEKTKVFLAGIFIHNPDIILMDEPTNHLDKACRKILYDFIKSSQKSMIIVSHDRTLLNLIDTTLELTSDGIITYGGNYEFYKDVRTQNLEALQKQVEEKEKELRKAKKIAQQTLERQQKRSASSKKSSADKGLPRIILNNLQSEAEKSTSKLKDTHNEKLTNLADDVKELQKKSSSLISKNLKLNIEDAQLHKGKSLVNAIDINFRYEEKMLWENPISLQIFSGDRINISGENGSGKSTLIKLIFDELKPTVGNIQRNDFSKIYIDQEYSMIENELTVYEQVEKYNSQNYSEPEVKSILTHYQFTYEFWDKKCKILSGGEKMKLLFCCMEINNSFPDMIALDEPTNNLDINSLEIVSSTLKSYKGTLLVISHDEYFLEEVGIASSLHVTQHLNHFH